MTNFFADES